MHTHGRGEGNRNAMLTETELRPENLPTPTVRIMVRSLMEWLQRFKYLTVLRQEVIILKHWNGKCRTHAGVLCFSQTEVLHFFTVVQ